MKLITALAVVLALALPAAAEPAARSARTPTPKPAATQPTPKKKPVFFDFTGDNIDGDRIRPDGTTIFGLRSARHGSLIRLRGDFIREIVKTGERL
jgi:hypothetical protein